MTGEEKEAVGLEEGGGGTERGVVGRRLPFPDMSTAAPKHTLVLMKEWYVSS